jgi:hypothetical protein
MRMPYAVLSLAVITRLKLTPRPLYLSLPATPWVRRLDTTHGFADALDALAQACRDAATWAAGTQRSSA